MRPEVGSQFGFALQQALDSLTTSMPFGNANASGETAGPELSVTTSQVRAAMHCRGDLSAGPHAPVLFLHGTTSSFRADLAWNWAVALEAKGWAYCGRGSAFLTALDSGPATWPGIDYTEVSTRLDEVVVPSTSAYLPPASNVTNTAVQDLCPLEAVEHFGMAYDNAAWLIGFDALTHPGPAQLSRISRSTCGRLAMPAVSTLSLATNLPLGLGQTVQSTLAAPIQPAEPALAAYAR